MKTTNRFRIICGKEDLGLEEILRRFFHPKVDLDLESIAAYVCLYKLLGYEIPIKDICYNLKCEEKEFFKIIGRLALEGLINLSVPMQIELKMPVSLYRFMDA